MATKGATARGLCVCIARATNSLPVPDSPVTRTAAGESETRAIILYTSSIEGVRPIKPDVRPSSSRTADGCLADPLASARRAMATNSSMLNGLLM